MVLEGEQKDLHNGAKALPDDEFAGFRDVPLALSVELGRRKLSCEEVVALRVGAILSLRRSAGDNVALLLNGRRIGAGEIVVIEDQMGLRITEIVGRPQEGK